MATSIPNPKNPNSTLTRDEHGRFVKSATPKVDLKVSGGATIVTHAPTGLDEPLLVVNNPFKRLLKWIDYLRRHHATTLAFKITIPLIALPAIIYGAYQVGKRNPSYVIAPTPTPAPISISKAGILKQVFTKDGTKYSLLQRDGTVVNLENTTDTDLSKFSNRRVLVSGLYNPTNMILKLVDISDLEILPTLAPSPTPTVTPTPSPTPTEIPTPTESPTPTTSE